MKYNIYHPDYVKGLFNRMSRSYERMNYITSFGFSIRWRKQCIRTLRPTGDGAVVLDLLTGMGETWGAIKQHMPQAKFTALDFSEGMLQYAKRKNESRFKNEIEILQQDMLCNTLPDNHFDIAICAFGLKTFNTEQLHILASEIRRILKPGGQFAFVEVSRPDNIVLKALYRFYLKRIIPLLGSAFLGDPEEYKMLWQYTDRFGNAKAAAEIFAAAGLSADFRAHFYGCATGVYGAKSLS